jgi:repressor LexA
MAPRRRTKTTRSGPRRARTGSKRQTRPATPRQTEILTFVRNFTHKHGYSPTYDEIAEEFGISKVTVFEHLTTLEERGLLHREKHKARSLHLADHLQLPDERPTCLPLMGRVAAGAPIEAIANHEVLDLEDLFSSDNGLYVLQVNGDSMIDDQIADGDYVVVEKRNTPLNGEMVVAYLEDGEVTLKRFYREKNRIRLQPANPKYKPIFVRSLDIQGVVVGVIRKLN